MPRGLKPTSELITIGFNVTESGANTFTQGQVDLQLNPLDLEVFVVQAVDLDPLAPDNAAGTNSDVESSLSTTNRVTIGTLADSNVVAVCKHQIRSSAAASPAVGFTSQSMESPATQMEYMAIIATNDFFVQIEGAGNSTAKAVRGKLYGYRAKASAEIFAALTQSELLSQ